MKALSGPGQQGGDPCHALAIEPSNPHVLYALVGWAHTTVSKSLDGGAQWVQMSGSTSPNPYVNRHATDLVLDPTPPHPLYVCSGGNFGRLTKSTDGGQSWRVYGTDLGTFFPDTLCIDPQSPQVLYARGSMRYRDDSQVAGIFKSTDGGESWTLVYQSPPGMHIVTLVLAPSAPHILYASTGWKR
jgi:hypothetical protein